ncbi:2-dehydro-3-deoxygalactonokinase [Pseudogemmobacter bohemicus]|uniref:2-dehydro-3-deoxygalactonokinase n=1 Tax=Pseudogemmobacter bohemicus TaxID=2250708 RepID=UPI0013004ED1|nr:2-dehydro-3-deoxygalactonokinase [Pseudogemmobacter bohemicus]
MRTGWVIAAPLDAGWAFTTVSASGETAFHEGADPDLASGLLEGGARIGLVLGHEEAPLAALPCDPIRTLAGIAADGAWRILPRFSQTSPLMLSGGEELILAGAMAIAPKFDGTILVRQAGRALWAQVSAGEVVSILGSVTPALRAGLAPGAVSNAARVAEAASETLSRPERLSALLASLSAQRRLAAMDHAGEADLVAGWLLGAELASAKAWWLGQPVLLIADEADGAGSVLAAQGLSLHPLTPGAALLAGLKTVAPL